jgi:lysophospholipase L1-like esterase
VTRARGAALAVALGLAGASVAPAAADHRLTLTANAREGGWIGLRLHSAPGVAVTIREVGGTQVAQLTPDEADTRLRRAVPWRCKRRTRRFVVTTADGQTASAEIRTPSCAKRLVVVAARETRAGSTVRARVVDRWHTGGLRVRVCVDPPGGVARCRRTRLRSGRDRVRVPFEAVRQGGWQVSARTPYGTAARTVRAIGSGGLSVLATGDSMMQRLDTRLAPRLARRGVRMRSDTFEATGISKPGSHNWVSHAHRQAGFGADVVVMFIGAVDAFPMGGAACCSDAWVTQYARRVRAMMAAYARGGRSSVLWLTLPTPREGFARQSFPAVNRALRRAAGTLRRDVRILDMGKTFSPGGQYRKWIRRGDREVGVRQADGIHLSDQGAAIASKIVVRTLREERVIP